MPNFNAFMHRRNIFRKEPDFKKLALEYQELKPFISVSAKNKLKFDFKNPDALRSLTCILLHKYFQKKITLAPDRMIPAVPQRLNYICWVEDLVRLLEVQNSDLKVCGLDIGTGASCIFPILACHRNPAWSFVGVDADEKSYEFAVINVQQNYMDNRIRLMKINKDQELYDIVSRTDIPYPLTFIMCNPPFFEQEYDVTIEMNTNIVSRPKSSANTSEGIESVVSGGEIAFVGRMLEASQNLKQEVTIYTSMLGRKQSLIHFKQTLSSLSDENLTWTWAELCQGKTIRYAIAWSFKPGLNLTRAPPLKHGKNKSWKFKLIRKMPKRDGHLELMENSEFLKNLILKELMIAKTRVTRQSQQIFEMLIKTNDKTWTNQRRKRREQMNKHKHKATTVSLLTNIHAQNLTESCDADSLMFCDNESASKGSNVETASGRVKLAKTSIGTEQIDMNAESIEATSSNFNQNESSNDYMPLLCGNSRKRKNASSCSSSPTRICPSPNDELTDDDNQSTDSTATDNNEDSSSRGHVETKRICLKDDEVDHMDDIYDYLLCCRVSLTRVCHDLYFQLKLEHPCTAASDAYDLFLYFRNKLTDK